MTRPVESGQEAVRARAQAIVRLEFLASRGLATCGTAMTVDALRYENEHGLRAAVEQAQADALRLSEWSADGPRHCAATAAHCWDDAEHSAAEARTALRLLADRDGWSADRLDADLDALRVAEERVLA